MNPDEQQRGRQSPLWIALVFLGCIALVGFSVGNMAVVILSTALGTLVVIVRAWYRSRAVFSGLLLAVGIIAIAAFSVTGGFNSTQFSVPSERLQFVPSQTEGDSPQSEHPTALCNDGTVSFSATRQGTCSHHRGVRTWYDR